MQKPQKQGDTGEFKTLANAARRLYDLGLNVVPVGPNKKPVTFWNATNRQKWEELEKYLPKASGLAVTGSYLEDDDYGVVVLDLDDVDAASEVLRQVFSEEWRARLCGQGYSFCGLTGPRPKNRVTCDCKAPGEDCDCVVQDTGEHKKLSELQRGMYIVVRVPKRCLPSGTVRSDAIEVMVSNYEVVYGKHPSGAYYQPVKWEDGRWVPISIEDVGQGEVITCDELKALIALVEQSVINWLEETGARAEEEAAAESATDYAEYLALTESEPVLPEPTKDLSGERIDQIVNSIRPIWWLEREGGGHYHDEILFGLSSIMRRAGIKYEVARKVVERIINTGIQDISDKVDQNTLQRIIKNEERHFKETVDYIYTKPTAKLWGRAAFEYNLKRAIQKAIEKGLLKLQEPEEWFDAIIHAITGINAVVTEEVLDEYLPREEGPINVPQWARDLEAPKLEYCLSKPICDKALVTHTREDSQYVVIAIKSVVKRGKKKDGRKPNFSPIALLPKFMAQVHDPFYSDWFFIALHDGKVIVASTDFDNFIEALRNAPGSRNYIIRNEQYLDLIKAILPRVRQVISAGITDNGIVDPYGVLDVTDYGVEPLLKAYEWIKKYYPSSNAKWAWIDVMAGFAKVITPLVRFHNRTFNDMVVYNVGRGGEGKSTLVRYILLQLLGGDDAKEHYLIVIDGAVRTEPQLRNLLALNRLPLILDEQNRKALANNVGIFLSAVVGLGTTGIQSARYGHGIAVKFRNLRGMIVFTNVPFVSFLRDIVSEASDYAIIRRFVEVAWDSEPISPDAFKDLPELKPIYGFATRLWQKYRDELVKSADLLELIEKLAIAIGREYLGDPKVDEMVKFTLDIIKELREAKKNERLALTDADALVARAYEFVASELKTSPSSAVKVLRYLLENPQRAGIKLTKPRSSEELERKKTELDNTIHTYLMYPYGIEETSDRGTVSKDPDATALYTLLRNAYDEGKVYVVLFTRSPLIPGTPRVFLGAPESSFTINGVKKNGYAIPLAKLVRIFLERELENENEGSDEATGESSSNGETP
jgi:hypothetical protein